MKDPQAPEPRCYNCGSLGHWAVACPEPTRETPAGLAAWRKSSSCKQGAAKTPSYGSGSKRAEGPIITKYTPPPPSVGQGMAPYPPPPPSLYPGPGGLFPHYSPPLPPFSAAYPQPPYPYATPQFTPPAAYGARQYGQATHGGLPAPLPQSGSMSRGRPNSHEYMPPLLPPFAAPLPQPSSSPSYRPAAAKSPPQKRPYTRPELTLNTAASKPPSTRISHPLPPKPPPSHDQMKANRDIRNRKPQDHLHLQEKLQKSFRSSTPSSSYPRQNAHGSPLAGHCYPPRDSILGMQSEQRVSGIGSWEKPAACTSGSDPNYVEGRGEKEVRAKSAEKAAASEVSATDSEGKECRPEKAEKRRWFRPVEQGRSMDAAVSPNKPASPRKTDASGGLGDSAGTEGIDSPKVSDGEEDGEITSNDYGSPSPARRGRRLSDGKGKWLATEQTTGRKRDYSHESDVDELNPKRRRSNGSACLGSKASESSDMNSHAWDSLDIPRQADRKRRGLTASHGSQQSSASSRSSDLNSLEAELLGRPTKQRQAGASSPRRQRPERRGQSKPKRRQANTNSAYR